MRTRAPHHNPQSRLRALPRSEPRAAPNRPSSPGLSPPSEPPSKAKPGSAAASRAMSSPAGARSTSTSLWRAAPGRTRGASPRRWADTPSLWTKTRQTFRVTLADGPHVRRSTSRSFAARAIEADLRPRDFTVNAMAAALTADGLGPLLDPFGGREDLRARLVRMVSRSGAERRPAAAAAGAAPRRRDGDRHRRRDGAGDQGSGAVAADVGGRAPARRVDAHLRMPRTRPVGVR